MQVGSTVAWRDWFKSGGLGWITAGLLLMGGAWLRYGPSSQDAVRQLGLLYELVGVVVVVIEIRKTSAKNLRTPIAARLFQYLKRIPISFAKPPVVVGKLIAAECKETAFALASLSTGPGTTIEQRVAYLEAMTRGLQTHVEHVQVLIDREVEVREAAVTAEGAARADAVRSLQEQIKEIETGGLDLSLFGVFWLILGMLLSTATPEVCKYILHW